MVDRFIDDVDRNLRSGAAGATDTVSTALPARTTCTEIPHVCLDNQEQCDDGEFGVDHVACAFDAFPPCSSSSARSLLGRF